MGSHGSPRPGPARPPDPVQTGDDHLRPGGDGGGGGGGSSTTRTGLTAAPETAEDWDRFITRYTYGDYTTHDFSAAAAPPRAVKHKPQSSPIPTSSASLLAADTVKPLGTPTSEIDKPPTPFPTTEESMPKLSSTSSDSDAITPSSEPHVVSTAGAVNQDPAIPNIGGADDPQEQLATPNDGYFREPTREERGKGRAEGQSMMTLENITQLNDDQEAAEAKRDTSGKKAKTRRRRNREHQRKAELASAGKAYSADSSDAEDEGPTIPVRKRKIRQPRSRGGTHRSKSPVEDDAQAGGSLLAGGAGSVDVLLDSGTGTSTSLSVADFNYDLAAERSRIREFYDEKGYMPAPRSPADTLRRRLRIIRRLGLDKPDKARHESLDRFTRLAVSIFKTGIALVSVIAKDRQVVLSSIGIKQNVLELDTAFCTHMIIGSGTQCMVVPNAAEDWRFRRNPFVDEGRGPAQFYAGAPLRVGTGPKATVIGSLCIFDDKSRDFADSERALLQDLADCVVSELELIYSQQANVESSKLHQISVDFLRRSLKHRPNERAGSSKRTGTTETSSRSGTSQSGGGKRVSGADTHQSDEDIDIYDEACREIRVALDAYAVAVVDLSQFHLFYPAYQTSSVAGSSTRQSGSQGRSQPGAHSSSSRTATRATAKGPASGYGSTLPAMSSTGSLGTTQGTAYGSAEDDEAYNKPTNPRRARQTYAVTDPLAPGRVPQVLFVPGGPREGVRQSKRVPLKEDEDPHGQLAILGYSSAYDGFAFNFGSSPVARKIISEFIASNVKTRKVWYTKDDSEGVAQSINHLMPPGTETSLAMPVFGFDGQVAFAVVACWTDPLYTYPSGAMQFVETIAGSLLASVIKEKLHLAERAQLTFAAAASHELRTPLHQINNAAHLLRTALHPYSTTSPMLGPPASSQFSDQSNPFLPPALSPEDRIEALAQLEIIEANGLALGNILENIIDTLEVGRMNGRPQGEIPIIGRGSASTDDRLTDLATALEKITDEVMDFENKARRVAGMPGLEDVEVILEVLPRHRGRWMMAADSGPLVRALSKIIHNACKFTDKGYIHITVQDVSREVVLPAGYDNSIQYSTVSIDVKDTGRGMSADFLEKEVLRPFSKADPFMPGSGLGLGLAQRMIEILGGTLAITSALNKGTLIHVECPLRLLNDDNDSDQEDLGSGDPSGPPEGYTKNSISVRQDGIYLAGFAEAKDPGTRRVGKSLFRQLKLHFCRVTSELNYSSLVVVPDGAFDADKLAEMVRAARPKAQLILLGKANEPPQTVLFDNCGHDVTPAMEFLRSIVLLRLSRPLRPTVVRRIMLPPPEEETPHVEETYISPVVGGDEARVESRRPSLADVMPSSSSTIMASSGHTIRAPDSSHGTDEMVNPSPMASPDDERDNDPLSHGWTVSRSLPQRQSSLGALHRGLGALTISPSRRGSAAGLPGTEEGHYPLRPVHLKESATDPLPTLRHEIPQTPNSFTDSLTSDSSDAAGDGTHATRPGLSERRTSPRQPFTALDSEALRVLVVEDNPVNRRILTTMLKRVACKFAEAVDGVDAVNQFSSFRPDLVLLDINMPRKDGFETAAEMRSIELDGGWERCRIIAVTAMGSESHKRKGLLECGIDEWRTKPVGIHDLRLDVEAARKV